MTVLVFGLGPRLTSAARGRLSRAGWSTAAQQRQCNTRPRHEGPHRRAPVQPSPLPGHLRPAAGASQSSALGVVCVACRLGSVTDVTVPWVVQQQLRWLSVQPSPRTSPPCSSPPRGQQALQASWRSSISRSPSPSPPRSSVLVSQPCVHRTPPPNFTICRCRYASAPLFRFFRLGRPTTRLG